MDTKHVTAPIISVAFQDNSTFRVPATLTCTALSHCVDRLSASMPFQHGR